MDQVSFDIAEGEIMGLVGESGSGKTMIGRSLLKLFPTRRAHIAGGSISLAGQDITGLDEESMVKVRGRDATMIFQNPSSHLDPVKRAGDQVAETVAKRDGVSWNAARERAGVLFQEVGIADPRRRLDAYPHELSGGMRQRVMIAAALACRPRLLIADEPTTALDVTVQKQILDLLLALRDRTGLAMILITHDLAVVAECCDTIGVLYAGRLAEYGRCADVLLAPLHPYTQGLIASQPELAKRGERLPAIPGQQPGAGFWPSGCRFHPRCGFAEPECTTAASAMEQSGHEHIVACRRWRDLAGRAVLSA